MRQLVLNIARQDLAVFDNFYPGKSGKNQLLLDYLNNINKKPDNFMYLYSKPKSGLTHILQALCQQKSSCLYLPLDKYADLSPEILMNLTGTGLELIVIDNIEHIAGHDDWEVSLFNLYNNIYIYNQTVTLIIGSHKKPVELLLKLADLKSRLQSMLMLEIQALDDDEKINALMLRAQKRGFVLPEDTARFLLEHAPRDMGVLFSLLEKLDKCSLEQKRRLTIPFVRAIMQHD